MTDSEWEKLVERAAVAMVMPITYSQGQRTGAPPQTVVEVARVFDALGVRELVEAAEDVAGSLLLSRPGPGGDRLRAALDRVASVRGI